MWELDYKESWEPKNWCFWTVVLEKTLESPLDCKENHPVHPKGDQSWVFIGRTDVEAETPIFWPPDVKSWLIWKDPDAGKDWRQEEKRMMEDGMVGWHHWLNGHEFGSSPGVDDEQGGLACCGSWCCKESDPTERLNWTELNSISGKAPDQISVWVQRQKKNWCLIQAGRLEVFPLTPAPMLFYSSLQLFHGWGPSTLRKGLPGWLSGRLPANAGDTEDMGVIPGCERSPREGNDNPFQDSCLEIPMDRGA